MVILPKHRLLFVSTPKCATNTLYEVLCRPELGGVRVMGEGFHPTKAPQQYARWKRFTVCRNPYDRFLSLWRSAGDVDGQYVPNAAKGRPPDVFADWLIKEQSVPKRPLFYTQTAWHRRAKPTHLVRLERLRADLESLLGEGLGELPQHNTTEGPTWAEMGASKELTLRVLDWCAEDFENLHYPVT